MDVGTGGSFRREACMSGVRRASRPLRTQGTEKPPARRSLLRRANHTPPGRLRGARQRGGLVSSHSPESQRPTRKRCCRARGGFWDKEQTQCPGPRASRRARSSGHCPPMRRAMLGGPAGLGACHLQQQSPGGEVQPLSLGPRAGGQERKEPLKQPSSKSLVLA